MTCDRALLALQRISDALGVPASAFDEWTGGRAETLADQTAQTLELVRLFSAIDDPDIRAECLAYVRKQVGGALKAPGAPMIDRALGT